MRIFTLIALLCSASFVFAQDFTIQTSSATQEGFSFKLHAFNRSVKTLSIDWGSGPVVQTALPNALGVTYTAPAGVSGSKAIKIYSDGVEAILLTGGGTNPIVIDNFIVGATNYLTQVQFNECDLKAVDLSNASLLKKFSATYSKLTTLNLQTTALEELNIAGSTSLSSITLPTASKVKELNLNNTALTNASLSQVLANAPLLEEVSINYLSVSDKISAVDFSHNTDLKSITVINNALTGTLDLTGLNKLEVVNLANNGLTGFIATSPVLTKLTLNNNSLTSVNLTGCIVLNELSCSNNSALETIDLTSNVALKDVYLQQNALKSIKLPSSVALDNLNIGNNALDFNTLPRVKPTGTYTYSPQSGILPISLESDLLSVDMSKHLPTITDGPVTGTHKSTVTKVNGFKGATVTELPYLPPVIVFYAKVGDKYTFDRTKMNKGGYSDVVFFEVENAAFPGLKLATSQVELGQEPVGINPSEETSIVVYYNSASSEIYYEAEGAKSISVINLMGQVAHKQSLASDKDAVSVDNLAKGVYVVQIATSEGKTITRKVVIK